MILFLCTFASGLAPARSSASSTLSDEVGKHPANHAVDGLLQTGWAESAVGNGEGQWWEINLAKKTEINTISIWPGNLSKGVKTFQQYARPKLIRILVDGKQQGTQHRLQDRPGRVDLKLGVTGRRIRIIIDESFEGIVSEDLFISEFAVNFPNGRISSFERWSAGKEAQREQKRYKDVIEKNFFAHKDSELSDKDALKLICDAAADGIPSFKKKAQIKVPDGYRIQALKSSEDAQKALRKLKDPNAIPCLELAELRSHGPKSRKIKSDVEYFYALRTLIGGQNYNVKNWGESGWTKGELQGFGEPLPLEIDRFGNVWVADTGNNRIQIFDENGRVNTFIGGKKEGISRKWFKNGQPWYVSGSKPGKKGRQLANPVDLVLIEGKKENSSAVLDAFGKITLFDEANKPIRSWKVEHSNPAEPKLGGTAYLVYIAKKKALCAIIQNQGACYNLASENLSTWEIEDGTPSAVEVMKNGKILMAFNDTIVSYNMDGFRDRVLIDSKILGDGFEYLDMTYDEKNRLWIVTDKGEAFEFKKPGKLLDKIKITNYPLQYPRIAVQDQMIYLLSEDKIKEIDVKQLRVDRAEKAKEE